VDLFFDPGSHLICSLEFRGANMKKNEGGGDSKKWGNTRRKGGGQYSDGVFFYEVRSLSRI